MTEPAGVADRCATAKPLLVHAAAGHGFAEVRFAPVGTAVTGFTVTSSPGNIVTRAGSSATSAHVSGLISGISYTFTVSQDGGPASDPSNAVVPSPAANVITNVIHHPQTRNLTCEEAALEMALTHEGIFKTENDVLNDIGVDLTPATFDSQGRLHWGNPYTSFVGNPDGSETSFTGYGTYYSNIARAARDFGGDVIQAGEQIDPSAVYAAILGGHPVVAWVTGDWKVHQETKIWITDDGQTITWHGAEEHAVALVGVELDTVIVDNPLNHQEWQRVSKATFESVYEIYNRMAVVIR